MIEDTPRPPPITTAMIPQSLEHQMLSVLVRIEKLLEGYVQSVNEAKETTPLPPSRPPPPVQKTTTKGKR